MSDERKEPEQLLTLKQAAARLQCSRETIYRLAKTGDLELIRLGPSQRRHLARITERSLRVLVDRLLERERARAGVKP